MNKRMASPDNISSIIILEDDVDQMNLLIHIALTEIQKLIDDENTNDKEKHWLRNIQVIKVADINSLRHAASIHKNILLALLDCNAPNAKGGAPHDQLVKTNHAITGQHKSVDIVIDNLPGTPITTISSMDRFQKIVHQYYERKYNLNVHFIRKNDLRAIAKNIEYHLRQQLNQPGINSDK